MCSALNIAAWGTHTGDCGQQRADLQAGNQPSNEQLINEQRAAEAVVLARDELLAAMEKG
jgi:hypothetical protein